MAGQVLVEQLHDHELGIVHSAKATELNREQIAA